MPLPNPHYHTSDSAVRKRYMAHVEAIRRKRQEPKPEPSKPQRAGRPTGILARAVIATAADGTQHTYPSINMAARATGADQASISKVLRGDYQRAGGYFWQYAQNDAA